MGMLDQPANPSDGRFDAPDPSRFDAPAPARPRRWIFAALALAIYLARFELHSVKAQGWLAAATAAGIILLYVGEIALGRKQRQALNEKDDPYTEQQHITR